MAKWVQRAEVVAYEDLGPEAVRRLEIVDLPVVVVSDARGDLFSASQRMTLNRASGTSVRPAVSRAANIR